MAEPTSMFVIPELCMAIAVPTLLTFVPPIYFTGYLLSQSIIFLTLARHLSRAQLVLSWS